MPFAFIGKNDIVLRRLPVWRDTGTRYSNLDVIQQDTALFGVPPIISDAVFTDVPEEWLTEALAWVPGFLRATGLHYVAQSFDCDKYAKALTLAAEIACARAQVPAAPRLGRLAVRQNVAWGGVAAGGGHAVNSVKTPTRRLVVEPQSGTVTDFATYPNRTTIFRHLLGG